MAQHTSIGQNCVSQSVHFSSSLSTMSKEKYIFHLINAIRSRPDDNPQSKNGTVFEQIFTEASEGVPIMDSSANSSTKYLNQPWMRCLTLLNLIVAHPSVRWRGYTDLLSKFIGISDYLKTVLLCVAPDSQPTEPWLPLPNTSSLGEFSRTH